MQDGNDIHNAGAEVPVPQEPKPGAELGIQYVDGTYSKGDYAVLARLGSIVLGFKLVLSFPFLDGERRIFVGFRVRATTDPESPINITDPSVFGAAFPAITFEKADITRASMHVGIGLKKTDSQQHLVLSALDAVGFYGKVIDWLGQNVPGEALIYTPGQVEGFLRELITERFKGFTAPEVLGENPTAQPFATSSEAVKALAAEFGIVTEDEPADDGASTDEASDEPVPEGGLPV